MDKLAQDLAYGLRTLRRTPVFTIVVVMSLGLGIGANTAVFTIINAVMLRELPVPHPGELVRLSATPVLSFAMFQDLRARQQVFTDILATTREWPVRLTIPDRANTTTLGLGASLLPRTTDIPRAPRRRAPSQSSAMDSGNASSRAILE